MPKMKTKSAAKKRFKTTGSGKITHERANHRHNFESKPSTRTRRLKGDKVVSEGDKKSVKRMLGQR